MSYMDFFAPAEELPLDRPVPGDGGMCSIFRKIACVGDSLASGEFEVKLPEEPTEKDPTVLAVNGQTVYLDCFAHSWGQHLARMAGTTVLNFSRGGMTASEYCKSFAAEKGYWDPALACEAYIVGLGVNDVVNARQAVGSIADLSDADPFQNADTFAGWFGQLLARLRAIAPTAPLFLITMPRAAWQVGEVAEIAQAHAALMYDMAAHFGNAYVIDLYRYGPVHDRAYEEMFYLGGHLTAVGYRIAAEQIVGYIDYIIRHNPKAFRSAGLIGTPYARFV